MTFIREEDEVVILSLDRLGRNSQDISNILEVIKQKSASINILNLPSFEGIQDSNLKNLLTNLVLEIQKYTAEKERKRQGIELAKAKEIYKGGVVQYSNNSSNPQRRLVYETVVNLLKRKAAGEAITIKHIAEKVGITRNTVYRIKKELER